MFLCVCPKVIVVMNTGTGFNTRTREGRSQMSHTHTHTQRNRGVAIYGDGFCRILAHGDTKNKATNK